MSKPVIRVEQLGKQYTIGGPVERYRTFRETIARAVTAPFRRFRQLSGAETSKGAFWALRDVTFDIAPGEVIGIIGRNGAGKSTLLKLLSGITEPNTGRIEIEGRVASLLEVGTGFHPELTGRENIYLNGSILGMGKKEIESKFDQIVDFAGMEKFIDTPAKRYSSGMQVRLGFAIAAHLEPDVLIIDEVLAVGDVEFQRKCIGKVEKVVESGRTVLIVSHNLATLQALCSKAILLEQGRMIYAGETREAISTYLQSFDTQSPEVNLAHVKREERYQPVITKIGLFDQDEQPTGQIGTGSPLTVKIHYLHDEPLRSPRFSLTFATSTGINVFFVQNHIQSLDIPNIDAHGVVSCHIPQVPLVPGKYYITCECGARARLLDRVPRATSIEIVERDIYGTGQLPKDSEALVLVDATWNMAEGTAQLAIEP